MTGDKDVFARWSDRRRAVAAEEAAEPPIVPEPAQGEETEEDVARWLADNELPEPEELGLGDDFKAFLRAGVPAILKKRALRQLWQSNPVLANLDGLNDYDGDLRDIAESAAGITTDYEVGRGFMKKVAEVIGEDLPPQDAPEADEEEEAAPEPPDRPEPVPDPPLPVSDAPVRSRMAFHFDD